MNVFTLNSNVMKSISYFFLASLFFSLFSCSNSKTIAELKRDPDSRKDFANVYWKSEYTLFDKATDEPIFPINKNEVLVYQIYYSSNENPKPFYGEFTEGELERHLFYKFKNKENCMLFCDRKNKQQ